MNSLSSSCRAAAWIPALAVACFLGTATFAQAETPVLLWGFQRGCDRMADIDQSIERDLYSQHHDIALLHTPAGKPLPACNGERCAQTFRAACPSAKGYLLGGQGIQGKVTRTRLWLYDLATGQIAYQDEYCHTCNVIGALSEHSRSLIEHPHFGPVPGPIPMYCGAASQGHGEVATKGPVYLTVYGDGKHKAPLLTALRAQLDALGRAVPAVESRPYSRDELDKLLAGQQGAKALSVLVQKEGAITVQLYDQKARVSDAEEVNCPDCSTDAVVSKLKEAVSDLLDRCAGSQCAQAVLSGAVQAPVAACEPFPAAHRRQSRPQDRQPHQGPDLGGFRRYYLYSDYPLRHQRYLGRDLFKS